MNWYDSTLAKLAHMEEFRMDYYDPDEGERYPEIETFDEIRVFLKKLKDCWDAAYIAEPSLFVKYDGTIYISFKGKDKSKELDLYFHCSDFAYHYWDAMQGRVIAANQSKGNFLYVPVLRKEAIGCLFEMLREIDLDQERK